MPAVKVKPTVLPAETTPEAAALPPVLSADPFAAFPEAQAALSTTTLMPPFSATPAGRGEAAPPSPTPEPKDAFEGFPEAPTPGATDSFGSFPEITQTRGYDVSKLKATPVADLVKDRSEFNPVEFYAKNEKALLADPAALKQLEDAYAEREKEKLTAGQFVKALATAPFHPIETAKTAGKAIKGVGEFIGTLGTGVGQVFKSAGQAAGALSAGDLKETSARIAEAASAFDTAQQRWVTTITEKALPRPSDIRGRLAYDAEFKKKELAAAEGNGEFARALGTDAAALKDSGVVLNPDAIQKLSVIEDPFFLVPIGGAVGVVSKGGKFLLARTAGEATAEAFAKLGNGLLERAAGAPVSVVGKLANVLGKVSEKAGEKTSGFLSNAGIGQTTIASALSGHGGLATGLAVARAAPTLLKYAGKAGEAIGGALREIAPAAGAVGAEAIKGTAEAGALSIPLFIGSTPEERESLLGMVAAGGAIRGGLRATEIGGAVAGRAAQDVLAKKIFETVDRGPIKESPYYGTDPKLDEAHAQHEQKLPPAERSVLNWTREFFRNSGIEVYALDNKTFTNHVPQVGGASAAEGFFTTRGERVNADGTRQPVIQILLNGDTNGLGHELYHAFKSLDPEGSAALESHIDKVWTPEEKKWISDQYNAALNGGRPESQWEVKLDKKQILEEAAAEVFGRVFQGTDLSGVKPSVQKKAALLASKVLEKMNYPLAGKGVKPGAGVSTLGVRPGTSEIKVSQEFLSNLAERAKKGELTPAKPAKKPIIAGGLTPDVAISKRSAPPIAPTTPEKVPAAPVAKPAAPAPRPETPPNIRVTPEEQLDYAAQRSKVTNAEPALAEAQKLPDPKAAEHVQAINDSMEAGHGVEIVHKGVIREGGPSPEKPVSRSVRRSEQEEAYIKEAMGEVPENIREQHQKVLFGTRWQKTGKSGQQLTARSLDKGLANIKNSVDMMVQAKEPVPYEVGPDGRLSEAGWSEAVQDLKDYWGNQDRGFRGDGETFVRPKEDIGVSIPPGDPRGPVAKLSPERTDFLNLVQGLNIPEAVTRQTAGKIPGNVKGQLLAELQGKTPAKPAAIKPEDVGRQTYKPIEGVGTRQIAEVNPLRNRLREAGAPVGKLIEVTENVNLKDIDSVTPRPDIPGRGGSTDITRSGFSVKGPNEEARSVAEKAAKASGVADYKPSTTLAPLNEGLGKRLADFYESAKSNPTDPAVKASYDALIDQLEKQGQTILDAGYKIEPFTGKGEPYPNSAAMVADVRDNKHLFYNPTEKNFSGTSDNPMLRPSKLGGVANDTFRWVHDFFGHAKEGYQFGPRGEYNAWKSHSEMLTPEAQSALAAETLAQNSWVNFGKHLRNEAGDVIKKGEPGYLDAVNKPFAEQKNILVPPELIAEAKKQSVAERPVTEVGDEILKMNPEEWTKATQNFEGGLTPEAYRLGLGLKDRADLDRLLEFRKQAEDEGKAMMKAGDFESAMPTIMKAQFFREAWEAAQGIASAKEGIKRSFPDRKPPFLAEGESFSPSTKAGEALAKDGFDFQVDGILGNRRISVIKNGEPVGYIASMQVDPKTAEVAMVHLDKTSRGKGVGEALYRELFSQLKKDGVELVAGDVVAPEPLAIRNNIFGGRFEKLDVQGKPATLDEALTAASLEKAGANREPMQVEAVNRIRPEDSFSVKRRETEAEAQKRIEETDYSKYNVPAEAKPVKKATGWLLPDKSFVPLTSAYHEQFLADNSGALNKKFGTDFSKEPNVEARLDALNKGFVRVRYEPNGTMHVQATAETWPKAKKDVLNHLLDHEDLIDRLHLSVLDRKGIEIDSASERLVGSSPSEKFDKISEAVDGLRTKSGGSFSVKPKDLPPPIPKDEITSEARKSYWLSPDGNFYDAGFMGHLEFAQKHLGTSFHLKEATNAGWVRVTTSPDTAIFAEGRPNRVQKEALEDFAFKEEKPIRDGVTEKVLIPSTENLGGGAFSVKGGSQSLPGFEPEADAPQKAAKIRVALSRQHPEAKPLEFKKDENGNFVLSNGKPLPVVEEYNLLGTPLAKETGKGIRNPVEREDAYTDALSKKIVKQYETAKKNPDIGAGEKWYSTCRARLRRLLGDDTKFFAELLGATSARTAVDLNFRFALEAYNQFKSGAYEGILDKYREGKKNFDAGEVQDYVKATGDKEPTRAAYLDWWIEKNDLSPKQSNGKKFGMNSRPVLKVLDGSWASEVKGPKTPNFTGNLTGSTFEATIDIWAARMLHRLSNEGPNTGKWRIQPGNETGVSEADFYAGQKAFRKAADKIGIKPDSLQAILWFAEKNYWEQKGWTDGIGAAKSDFNSLLAKAQKDESGRITLRKETVAPELDLGDIGSKK